MSSLYISKNPSRNWADDEDDDFDLDAYLAKPEPTLESLPPLQLPAKHEDSYCTIIRHDAPTETLPWAKPEQQQHPSMNYHQGGEITDSMVAARAIADQHTLPSHVGLSCYEDGTLSPWARVNYARNWVKMKVDLGRDGRGTALLFGSRMRDVQFAYVCEEMGREKEDVPLNVESTSAGEPPKPLVITDEGYYSDTSPPISPTLSCCEEVVTPSCCATRVGISPATTFTQHRARRDSQDALVPDDDKALGILTKATDMVANTSWMTVAMVATGVVAGVGMWFARGRR